MISRLFVLWRTSGDQRRFVVGDLWREASVFYFAYVSDLSAAAANGFSLPLEFPEHRISGQPYKLSGYLFPTFAQRIPSPRRPDYASLMEQWLVEHHDDPFEVLARSGGLLATDGLELTEWRAADDPLTEPLRMRIAGIEQYPGRDTAKEGESCLLVVDQAPPLDANAVQVQLTGGRAIGLVPLCYSVLVKGHLDRHSRLQSRILRPVSLPDDPRRWQLEVRVAATP